MNSLEYSLSDDDIENALVKSGYFLANEIYIITYNELENIDISTLPRGSCIVILYRTTDSYGHWTAIYRPLGTNRIFFFDSMGHYTDNDLYDEDIFPHNEQVGQTRRILTEGLYDSGYTVEYIDSKYVCQSQKRGINTCGKWCVFFLIFAKALNIKGLESLKRFLRLIKIEYKNNGLTLDDFVNEYYISLLNKK